MTLAPEKLETPPGYHPLDDGTLAGYLARSGDVAARLGGRPEEWQVREVGDGNLNLVFIVTGPAGGVAVKQALPYVRLVGESWPLPLSRAFFEHEALVEQARVAPAQTPRIYHYDHEMALTVMELLRPHVIMRKGLAAGIRYPHFARDIAHFMATTLFYTSDLALPAAEKKRRMAVFCGNTALCKITEDLIFTDPYRVAELNRWTSPQLDGIAAEFRADTAAKAAISELKGKFLTSAEAMIHGDLHTGSIMVTATETKVIDPEFAFYGPMGFDIGAVIGNLLLAYFAQAGHETEPSQRDGYRGWILDQVDQVWTKFEGIFLGLWRDHHGGDLYPADSVRRCGGAGGAAAGAGGLYGAAVRRFGRLRRRQDDPAHPGPCPYRGVGDDRRSGCARRLRERGRSVWRATCWSIAVSYRSIGDVTAAAKKS